MAGCLRSLVTGAGEPRQPRHSPDPGHWAYRTDHPLLLGSCLVKLDLAICMIWGCQVGRFFLKGCAARGCRFDHYDPEITEISAWIWRPDDSFYGGMHGHHQVQNAFCKLGYFYVVILWKGFLEWVVCLNDSIDWLIDWLIESGFTPLIDWLIDWLALT